MLLDPQAYKAMHRLYISSDRESRAIYRRARSILDSLEADPGAAAMRRYRIKDYWLIRIPVLDGADWILLWQMESEPVVRYLGPASFA